MTNKREFFKNITNYALYYGTGKTEVMSVYDAAIVEPRGQNKEGIKAMQQSGTLAIAYISVMEISETDSDYLLLKDEDFLKINGCPLINENYNTHLVDLRSRRWVSILMHNIGNLILNYNYDGVFLDTIGDIEHFAIPDLLQNQLCMEAVKVIGKIRELYGDIVIIQNNGLNYLLDYSWKLIDGVCWENPRFPDKNAAEWTKTVIDKLSIAGKEIIVMLLYEKSIFQGERFASVKFGKKVAMEKGFLIFITENYC